MVMVVIMVIMVVMVVRMGALNATAVAEGRENETAAATEQLGAEGAGENAARRAGQLRCPGGEGEVHDRGKGGVGREGGVGVVVGFGPGRRGGGGGGGGGGGARGGVVVEE